MNGYLIWAIVFILSGCNFTYENNANCADAMDQLRRETDSLKNELRIITNKLEEKNSPVREASHVSNYDTSAALTDSILSRKHQKEKQIKSQPMIQSKKNDTLIYFYVGTKKISVKIDPLVSYGKKKIRFYNPKGEVTFEQEDVRMSYSVSTDIKEFHPNGSVKRIVIHFNPDGSMHWYETNITFDTDNTPLWKEEITYPQTLDNMMNNKSYWDKSKNKWIKQETVIEQPYTH